MDRKTFRAIKLQAIEAVVEPDWEAFWRRICRWYSEKFSTPLPQVLEMSEMDVLQTYFEVHYETLEADQSEEGKKNFRIAVDTVIEGEETVAQVEQEAEDEEEAWAKELNEQVKKDWQGKVPQSPETQKEPNLEDIEDSYSLPGESEFPPDEE